MRTSSCQNVVLKSHASHSRFQSKIGLFRHCQIKLLSKVEDKLVLPGEEEDEPPPLEVLGAFCGDEFDGFKIHVRVRRRMF